MRRRMMTKVIIGSRESKLAVLQSEMVKSYIEENNSPEITVDILTMKTTGDIILDRTLDKVGGKGLFVKELDRALMDGRSNLSVHSLKDMPVVVPEGLVITAITQRADPGDAFVSPKYESFQQLPAGAKVGTSSLRRKAQLLHARPDLQIEDLRGNVNTRLRKMEEENFDGIILACAGLKRLGFGDKIRQVLPRTMCLPAVGQGALAIECRKADKETRELLEFLNDRCTRLCTEAERGFLATVEGGCQVPVGVHAVSAEAGIRVEAVIASLDGSTLLRDALEAEVKDAQEAIAVGVNLAEKLLARGGREILRSIGIEV